MAIKVHCGFCGKAFAAQDRWAGRSVKCPLCGRTMTIPSAAGSVPEESIDQARSLKAKLVGGEGDRPRKPPAAGGNGPSPPRKPAREAARPRQVPSAEELYDLDDGTRNPSASGGRGRPGGGGYDDPDFVPSMPSRPGATRPAERANRTSNPYHVKEAGGIGGALTVVLLIVLRIHNSYERSVRRQSYAESQKQESAISDPKSAPTRPTAEPWALPSFSEPGQSTEIAPGVLRSEVRITGQPGVPAHSGKLWLYLPSGSHEPGSLPCVLIAPAGTRLIHGMTLGSGDVGEHVPYVRAGLAVVAYELDGDVPDINTIGDPGLRKAVRDFVAAEAGLLNARVAIDFASSQVPQINPRQLYAAGHSSAGTVALLVAENETRLSGCAAFAPVVDVSKFGPPEAMRSLVAQVPGSDRLLGELNPRNGENKIGCPLFFFYAEDDEKCAEGCRAFADRHRQDMPSLTVSTVASGGHYNPMIQNGIPRAIRWIRELAGMPAIDVPETVGSPAVAPQSVAPTASQPRTIPRPPIFQRRTIPTIPRTEHGPRGRPGPFPR